MHVELSIKVVLNKIGIELLKKTDELRYSLTGLFLHF